MVGSVNVSETSNGNVKIEVSDDTGIVTDISMVPRDEWDSICSGIVQEFPLSEYEKLVSQLAAMSILLDVR